MFGGLVPALLGGLSIVLLYTSPACHGLERSGSPLFRSATLAIVGSIAVTGVLTLIAAWNRRLLPWWGYYVGASATCAILGVTSRKTACFLFHSGVSPIPLHNPFAQVASTILGFGLLGALSHAAFVVAATPAVSGVRTPYSVRVAVRFGLVVAGVVFLAMIAECWHTLSHD
jgi:hypothetical protein